MTFPRQNLIPLRMFSWLQSNPRPVDVGQTRSTPSLMMSLQTSLAKSAKRSSCIQLYNALVEVSLADIMSLKKTKFQLFRN
jgi:hypothetical protein